MGEVKRDVYRYSSDTNGIMYPRKDGLFVEWEAYAALKARAEQAEAALSVAQKDAERWRYVRNTWEGQAPELFYWHEGECIKHNPVSMSACKQLDAAIDAAIAHGGAGEGCDGR